MREVYVRERREVEWMDHGQILEEGGTKLHPLRDADRDDSGDREITGAVSSSVVAVSTVV